MTGPNTPFDASHGSSATSDYLLSDEFNQFIEGQRDKWAVQGLSIAVVNGNSSSIKGWGKADRNGKSVTGETIFNIASNTKVFTAIALGSALHEATPPLNWDSKVRDILPDWEPQDPLLARYGSIKDLLSHRTGMAKHDLSYWQGESLHDVVYSVRDLNSSTEFRDVFQYNNIMYTTAAYLVQNLTGLTFPTYVTTNIFRRLGMPTATFSPRQAALSGHLAEGFYAVKTDVSSREGGEGWLKTKYRPIPYFMDESSVDLSAGAGGILASAEDMVIWLRTLLAKGRHPESGEVIISENVIDSVASPITMYTTKTPYPELSPQMYGAGQIIQTYQGHQMIEHGGSLPGFRSNIIRFPNSSLGFVLLSNSDTATQALAIIKYHLAEVYLNLPKRVNWDERMVDAELDRLKGDRDSQLQRQPDAPLPEVALDTLEGSYTHRAYGTVQIHQLALNSSIEVHSTSLPSKLTPLFREVLQDISSSNKSDARPSTLIVTFEKPRLRLTHLVLQHYSHNVFNMTGWNLIQPSNEEPFLAPIELDSSADGPPTATFAVQSSAVQSSYHSPQAHGNSAIAQATSTQMKVIGMGWRGIWGAGNEICGPLLTEDVKASSEVWFDVVGNQ